MKKPLKTISVIFTVLLSIATYLGSTFSSALYLNFNSDDVINYTKIGHRGAGGIAPENTLISIRKALELKADIIEIDVQQTKDGAIILLHDTTVDRTTNGKGEVKNMTFSEISKLEAGSWLNIDFKNEKIPTLEEAISLVKGKAELLIEVKYGNKYYKGIEKKIVSILNQNNCLDWCIVHSFDSKILETFHEIEPKLRLQKILVAKLNYLPIAYDGDYFYQYNISDYNYIEGYNIYYQFANIFLINQLKNKGKKVNVWTLNDTITANSLIQLGVDGIITDYP